MKAELIFHDKVVEHDNSIVEIKIWSVPVTSDRLHGYKYSMVYIKDGKRIVGYDNHTGKRDHRHYGNKEGPYRFTTIDKLFEDFYKDLRRYTKQ
ncbi:MAG TPA: hypothetical protein ENG83_05110 [Nitrospirae bacterium]|nr:hypothetical protein BMS3Abin06_02550 [bacterium BMS3Abin06]HDH11566.1 hypothetical protein [Nitrospirota bacterium]HDZ01977.1 hypothetical protein [Nitrospirota bacterium]